MAEAPGMDDTDLLAELAELASAGRAAGLPELGITVLERTRERIRYLMEGASAPAAADHRHTVRTLASPEDLSAAFADLVANATEAGAPAWIINLLATGHMRLIRELFGAGSGQEQRLAPRCNEDQPGRLRRADGTELAVTVLDRSPLGVGLLGPRPLDAHELVTLRLDDAGGERRHGEVIFCLERSEAAFHIGLELLAPAALGPFPRAL
jgi:hypothetical protein